MLLLFPLCAFAQSNQPPRRSTPVDVDDKKPRTTLHYYDKHGEPLEVPVRFLAELDTVVAPKSKPVYPLYNGINVGLDFGDPILSLALGRRQAAIGLWANVSMFNWYFPTAEIGYAFSPALSDGVYSKSAPYFKLGLNYNFLYKSNPANQLFVGFRLGYSPFNFYGVPTSAESTPQTGNDSQDTQQPAQNAPVLCSAHSLYGDILGGIQVNMTRNFSLGWTLRYHIPFKNIITPATPLAENLQAPQPLYIPGFGTNSDDAIPLSLSFSASLSF